MQHTGTDPNIGIFYEDDHLLVIDKPHNVLSQEDHTGDPDVISLCRQYLAHKKEGSAQPYLGLVHRLDRPVGGLMLLAKNSRAAGKLSKQMKDRLIQKTYRAVTYGDPPANGVLTHYLIKDRSSNTVTTVSADHKGAKKALLSFEKLDAVEGLNLLAVHLQTGRPHQIRVQLAAEGWAIWGDYKYGSQNQPEGRTMALRAMELIFNHPFLEEEMHFELPPPAEQPWNNFSLSAPTT